MLKNIPGKTKSASTGFEPAEGGAVPSPGASFGNQCECGGIGRHTRLKI